MFHNKNPELTCNGGGRYRAPTSTVREARTMHSGHCALTIPGGDGLALAAHRLGALGAPATVVYIHGLLADSTYWAPVTQRLDERLDGGIAQIVYDQRGHGNSDRPHRRSTTTMQHLAEDLDLVLTRTTGAVLLVTHSTGSLLAHAWAERYPHRAAALAGFVIFNGSAEIPEFPSLPRLYRNMAKNMHRWRHGALEPMSAAAVRLLTRMFRRHAHPMPATQCDHRVIADALGQYRRTSLSPELVTQLREVPTFVVAGEFDPIVPTAQALELADLIWADCEIVPAAGHSLPHAYPDRAAEFILQALDVAYHADVADPFGTSRDRS
ncbi:pimeloyl-ACP methyl ester carboxylesterase [Nocardia sp. GAS34]|uniref:alpha/beta fold hydrolase n=1 Tax=unclassified Nocardia TaxID=2637762 RepID=UPI003D20B50A